MAINLKKGQSISLDKSAYDLSTLTMGLGWDVAPKKPGLGGIFGGNKDFDLDAYALLLNSEGKLVNYKEDVIYYAHLKSQDKTVVHTGDNLTGEGDGDDEQIVLKLNNIDPKYERIILGVTIYQAKSRNQNFGQVENAFVRAVDANNKEIARFSLSGDNTYQGKISMLMGEVYRSNKGWEFKALGDALTNDLNQVVGSFMS
jgi:tellurium resistance protein TerD